MFESNGLIGASLALALLFGGCEAGAEPESPTIPDSGDLEESPSGVGLVRWVGAVEDTDVRFALLAGRGKARLYFCGGAESYATATRWFDIAFDGGEHVDFQEQDWRVHAHLVGGGVNGEVELGDGVKRMVHAERVVPGTLAGLYEGHADCGRLGLVVTQAAADTLPTAQGACADTTAQPIQQVSAIEPINAEAGKIRVRKPGDGDATLLLQAATLEPL
jgi:hypothetical protein